MAGTDVRRRVRVVPSADGQVQVPADIASILGADAELEVGPGMVVTLRPAKVDVAPPLASPAGQREAPTGRAILDVRNLTVAYGATKAVDDVSFQVLHGEIFGLLGPNGAGKTSTLSAIEGLLKPRAGSVQLDGFDVQQRPAEAKARMGVQLQATSFQSELTIRQIVRLYSGLYGVTISDAEIDDQLEVIGLAAEAAKPFKQLSGGQQQRLSLFIAVIHEPSLLLLDEPTAGLDPQSRRQLWGRIEEIRKERWQHPADDPLHGGSSSRLRPRGHHRPREPAHCRQSPRPDREAQGRPSSAGRCARRGNSRGRLHRFNRERDP